MSANSSSPSSSSLEPILFECANSTVVVLISMVSNFTRIIILLPLSILMLYLAHQQWQQQRSFKMMTHSDIFTYHLAVMELIWVLGMVVFFCGSYSGLSNVTIAGLCLSSITFYGESIFHLLTCVERYLAVVHPITYLRLRNTRGVRIRNISVAGAWLLCFGGMSITILHSLSSFIILCLLVFSLIVISFCSLSILCVLIRPGPGEVARDRKRVEQSKQRAFYTIMAIMGVLVVWFVGLLVSAAVRKSQINTAGCVWVVFAGCFNLPSSLVLPLLYLQRAGKFTKPWCC